MRQTFYKLGQLLQNATILLQNATVVPKCVVYYKLRSTNIDRQCEFWLKIYTSLWGSKTMKQLCQKRSRM